MMSEEEVTRKIKSIENKIGKHQDFPIEGILFRDVMPILSDDQLLHDLIDILYMKVKDLEIDRVIGIEFRGVPFGQLIAYKLRKPFSPIRKKGKLPGELFSIDYDLEYGTDTLQIQKHSLPANSKCLLVDDLLATGGTMAAALKLVTLSGSQVTACLVIIHLVDLGGEKKLQDTNLISLLRY